MTSFMGCWISGRVLGWCRKDTTAIHRRRHIGFSYLVLPSATWSPPKSRPFTPPSWTGRGSGPRGTSAFPCSLLRWPGTVCRSRSMARSISSSSSRRSRTRSSSSPADGQDLLEGREGGIEFPLLPLRGDPEEHGPDVILSDVEVPSLPGEVHPPDHPPVPEVLQGHAGVSPAHSKLLGDFF